ncbi:MAG: YbhB/YbcL family Raf kinase inhibitor-like protein [Hamadaea sp.]|nr:YbhB/YbcL family Raf kinase inhibitor-like protein [Hamadaea sp.]
MANSGLTLRAGSFGDHDLMPQHLSKEGGNRSPALEWSGAPVDCTELVLLCEDPDAGATPFLHWLVTGIDPASTGTAEGQPPPGGREWPNDFGDRGYGGPRPPRGDEPHRYYFRLYAVREPVRLPDRPNAAQVRATVEPLAVASGVVVGRFAR